MQDLARLSDATLLQELHAIATTHRCTTAALIVHLGEVDARRLHVERGFPSLFCYCVERLAFSEDEACRRIEAARVARRFPVIPELLETGAVSLTALGLLKSHLTEQNRGELLAGVSGSSVRRAKEWLAARFPAPDVPCTIRKQPAPRAAAAKGALPLPVTHGRITADWPAPRSLGLSPAAERIDVQAAARPVSPDAGRIDPLSQDRFLVKFTASRAMRDKLEQARDLMRHANPNGALEVLLERATDLLIADMQKRQQGHSRRPSKQPRSASAAHVTRATRREVAARDGWRCAFVADDGRRCESRAFLELDHEIPRGRGGGSEAENMRILCRAHNRAAAERVYGREHVERAIEEARCRAGKSFTVREPAAARDGDGRRVNGVGGVPPGVAPGSERASAAAAVRD